MRDEEKVAKPPQLAQTGWRGQELFDHTTPSAPQRRLRYFFLCRGHPSCCSGGEFLRQTLFLNSDRFAWPREVVLRGSIDAAARSGSAGQRSVDNQEQNGSKY